MVIVSKPLLERFVVIVEEHKMMDEWMVAKATSNSYVKQQQGGKFHPGGSTHWELGPQRGGYTKKKIKLCPP